MDPNPARTRSGPLGGHARGLRSKLTGDAAANFGGGVLRAASSLFVVLAIAAFRGREEFALYALATAVMRFALVADCGISNTSASLIARELARGDTRAAAQLFWIAFGVAAAAAGVTAAILGLTIDRIVASMGDIGVSQQQSLGLAIRIATAAVVARVLTQVFAGLLQSMGAMRTLATLQTGLLAGTNLGVGVLAIAGGGTVAFLELSLAVACAFLFIHAAAAFSICQWVRWPRLPARGMLREITSINLLSFVQILGSVLFQQADKIIVNAMLGLQAGGLYSMAMSVGVQIQSLSALVVQPSLPALSAFRTAGPEARESVKSTVLALFWSSASIAFMGAILVFSATPLLIAFVPEEFTAEDLGVIRAAAGVYAVLSLNAVAYFSLLAVRRFGPFVALHSVSVALGLVAIYFASQWYGLIGAVIANLAACITVVMVPVAFSLIGIPAARWVRGLILPTALFATCAIASLFLETTPLVAIYLVCLILTAAGMVQSHGRAATIP